MNTFCSTSRLADIVFGVFKLPAILKKWFLVIADMWIFAKKGSMKFDVLGKEIRQKYPFVRVLGLREDHWLPIASDHYELLTPFESRVEIKFKETRITGKRKPFKVVPSAREPEER